MASLLSKKDYPSQINALDRADDSLHNFTLTVHLVPEALEGIGERKRRGGERTH